GPDPAEEAEDSPGRPGVEAVPGVRVDLDVVGDPERVEVLPERRDEPREARIAAAVARDHRTALWHRRRGGAVERRRDLVLAGHREHEREAATHAEADDAHAVLVDLGARGEPSARRLEVVERPTRAGGAGLHR